MLILLIVLLTFWLILTIVGFAIEWLLWLATTTIQQNRRLDHALATVAGATRAGSTGSC